MSRTLFAFTVCGLMILLAQPKSLAAATPTLAGSWELTFTPGTAATATAPVVPGLATFTTDGSVIETDGTELAPGIPSTAAFRDDRSRPATGTTYGSPGHGIWQLMPSMTSLYISYTSLVVNADGSLNSKNVTVATVTMATATSGTTFSGTYTTTAVSSSGTPPTTITGVITGQLIPHPALP